MWDFSQYTSREWAFNGLFRGSLEVAKAGAGARTGTKVGAKAEIGTRIFKIALRICCKLSLKYFGI